MSKFTEMSLAEQDKSQTVKFSKNEKSGVTVCRLFDRWYGRTFIGVSRCHDTDVFDEKKGRAIAFNKARKKELISDLRLIAGQRMKLMRLYEEEMKRIDKNESLKRIYLAGVNNELNELIEREETLDSCLEDVNEADSSEDLEHLKEIKLTQFAKIAH